MLFVILIIVAYAILMNAGNIITASAVSKAKKDAAKATIDIKGQQTYGGAGFAKQPGKSLRG